MSATITDKVSCISNPSGFRDIFYSSSLILQSSRIQDEKRLYKIILSKLQENSSLIKEGGDLDIYYVASELEDNVKEGYIKWKKTCYSFNK